MESQPSYLNVLSLSPYGKAIPYTGSGIPREDGHANYGFKNLKVKPEFIDTLPELVSDGALKSLVRALNAEDSSFFSVGCFSAPSETDQGHRYKGYIDFSWNCKKCVQDAINYFSLFFHFEHFLRTHRFSQPVKLDWVVEQAQFLDADVDGFCCAIFINTSTIQSMEQAYVSWQVSLQMVESFLGAIQRPSSTTIYSPRTEQLSRLTT
ncbi:MAG: hypothetical protein AAGC54_08780 [Cyanobacteria bacterium P01_F01_bin.4]